MSDSIVKRLIEMRAKDTMFLTEKEVTDEEIEDTQEAEDDIEKEETTPIRGRSRKSFSSNKEVDSPEDSKEAEEDDDDDDSSSLSSKLKGTEDKSINPLDNPYAVEFKLGDEVVLAYANGNSTDIDATVEGYDKKGFYRIKLDNGMTINGITDTVLQSLVKDIKESKCICGSRKFVTEQHRLICDTCGRVIRESVVQNSQEKSKKKKMIRSEAHPVSTAIKPSINETIRSALKNSTSKAILQESSDLEDSPYSNILSIKGEFWTRLPELIEDVEDLGFKVDEDSTNRETLVVVLPDDGEDYDNYLVVPIDGTERTLTLDFDRARITR